MPMRRSWTCSSNQLSWRGSCPNHPRQIVVSETWLTLLACPVAHHVNAPGILHGHLQPHVSQLHVLGRMCANFVTYPGECSIKRDGPRGKDAGSGTRRSVITKPIRRLAAQGPRCFLPARQCTRKPGPPLAALFGRQDYLGALGGLGPPLVAFCGR